MSERFLAGKTALVTGATAGSGWRSPAYSAGRGHGWRSMTSPARTRRRGAENDIRAAGAPASRFFAADLRDEAAIEAMVDAVLGWAGAVDVLVNNAGMQHTAALAAMPPKVWNDIIAVNLSAAFHTMRRLLPGMAERGYGRVVSIASVHGLVASVNKAPYVASKFGLVGLTRVAALEYAAAGITGDGRRDGQLHLPRLDRDRDHRAADRGPRGRVGRGSGGRDPALLREKQPSLRTSLPDEIAALALWLCAPAAHNVTGVAIPIDGGWTAQ